tara:strand:+ start:1120 stop:1476 length:357 start_codon:yes stop_codon:yes gene_type:complete
MPKKEFNFTDLSSKELDCLKDQYIDQKVNSMNNNELKAFVTEHISLQVKSTIGSEEELEAWQEMEIFFKDDFHEIIKKIQLKFQSIENNKNIGDVIQDKIGFEEDNEEESNKIDMWED